MPESRQDRPGGIASGSAATGRATAAGRPVEQFSQRLARGVYTLAWCLATPLVLAYLLRRSWRQPDYRRRIAERFGLQRGRDDDAPLIWIHAVSVGETRAAQPLIEALLDRYPGHRLLLTHMTPTGLEAGRELYGRWMTTAGGTGTSAGTGTGTRAPRIAQALLPYDYPWAQRHFLRAWRPMIGAIMETELWPNLVAVAREEGVPMALVSARLSARSLRKGLRWRALMAPALARLDLVLAQTPADAQRIATLGRPGVPVVGNLKFDVTPVLEMDAQGYAWRQALLAGDDRHAHRPTVLAASTRDGEEALLLDAWCAWRAGAEEAPAPEVRTPETSRPPLLIIVPRHPQRFDEVAREIERRGLRLARRTAWGARGPFPEDQAAEVLLGDSMGEMSAYYALADVAIIGGSLLPFGGQNLIEACAAGVPVVVGPHMFNFDAATDQAIADDAALRAPDAASALREALALVADPVACQTMGERAIRFALRHRGATARTVAALAPLIEGRPPD